MTAMGKLPGWKNGVAEPMEGSKAHQFIVTNQNPNHKANRRRGTHVYDSPMTDLGDTNMRDALRAAYIAVLAWQRAKKEGGCHDQE